MSSSSSHPFLEGPFRPRNPPRPRTSTVRRVMVTATLLVSGALAAMAVAGLF